MEEKRALYGLAKPHGNLVFSSYDTRKNEKGARNKERNWQEKIGKI